MEVIQIVQNVLEKDLFSNREKVKELHVNIFVKKEEQNVSTCDKESFKELDKFIGECENE